MIMTQLSNCCKAPLRVSGSGEGTNFYRCTGCDKPCDHLDECPDCINFDKSVEEGYCWTCNTRYPVDLDERPVVENIQISSDDNLIPIDESKGFEFSTKPSQTEENVAFDQKATSGEVEDWDTMLDIWYAELPETPEKHLRTWTVTRSEIRVLLLSELAKRKYYQHELATLTASYEASKAKKEIVHKAEILDILDEIEPRGQIIPFKKVEGRNMVELRYLEDVIYKLQEIRQRIKGE